MNRAHTVLSLTLILLLGCILTSIIVVHHRSTEQQPANTREAILRDQFCGDEPVDMGADAGAIADYGKSHRVQCAGGAQ